LIKSPNIKDQARIRELQVYSGHADAPGLLRWIQARAPVSGCVFLTHGEGESRNDMTKRLAAAGVAGGRVFSPQLDQFYPLTRGAAGAPDAVQPPRIAP